MFSKLKSTISSIRFIPPTSTNEDSEQVQDSDTKKNGDQPNNPTTETAQYQPALFITSYDRFTPPHPRPDLEYDCRTTPNPSREVRATNTGVDGALQAQLLDRDEFADMLSRAEEEIRRLMEERKKLVARKARDNASMTVRVGCLCGSGHHRSVAFAECLMKRAWPNDWKVKVEHRDLTEEVIAKKQGVKTNKVDVP